MARTLFCALFLVPWCLAGGGDNTLPDVAKTAGVEAGLVVHVGTTDGRRELELAAGGRRLVHGLALDDAARDRARRAICAAGRYGLASVERWFDPPRLPYADRLANLLVADLDALGAKAPTAAEIDRVLAPRGVALLRQGGQWRRTVKPFPPTLDEWTHFDYGPEGNGVSHDKEARQPNFVQWICGLQPIKLGGNPAAFIGLTGVRVANGRAFFDYVQPAPKRGRQKSMLHGRDAFSGVPLWTVARDPEPGRKRWQLVAVGDRIYTGMEDNGPLVALDAATGKPAVRFDRAGSLRPRVRERYGTERTQVRVGGGKLALNVGATLYVLRAGTGDVLWQYKEPKGRNVLWPSLSVAADRLFIGVQSADAKEEFTRWPYSDLDEVLCFELGSGKLVWRNTEVKGHPVGQMIYHDGNLALFCGSAIGGRGAGGWVSNITVADGKLQGQGTFQSKYYTSMYNAVVRDGAIWFAGHTTVYRADLKSGAVSAAMSLNYNQRCNRFCATDRWFITGFITYLDRDFNGTLQSVARSGCALGATPANGMIYTTPNACHCFTQLRGYLALSPEPVRDPVPDARRLEKGDGKPAPAFAGKPTDAAGPVVEDWLRQDYLAGAETPPVDAGAGRSVVAVSHEHRVEARGADGKAVWSFTAGGRVSSAPVVHDGTVYFGCHDGWVYALRGADGGLLWRYLAAPYERKFCAYGQLQSSWPVYGVVLHKGLVYAAAGLHPEVGGGVYVCGLDPKTGAQALRRTLSRPAARIETRDGKARGNIVPHCFLNTVPRSVGDQLEIDGFVFDPRTPDAELRQRLSTSPPKKKKR